MSQYDCETCGHYYPNHIYTENLRCPICRDAAGPCAEQYVFTPQPGVTVLTQEMADAAVEKLRAEGRWHR